MMTLEEIQREIIELRNRRNNIIERENRIDNETTKLLNIQQKEREELEKKQALERELLDAKLADQKEILSKLKYDYKYKASDVVNIRLGDFIEEVSKIYGGNIENYKLPIEVSVNPGFFAVDVSIEEAYYNRNSVSLTIKLVDEKGLDMAFYDIDVNPHEMMPNGKTLIDCLSLSKMFNGNPYVYGTQIENIEDIYDLELPVSLKALVYEGFVIGEINGVCINNIPFSVFTLAVMNCVEKKQNLQRKLV